MLIREYLGKALTHQKIVPGNTITSISPDVYSYTERTLPFTSGGTTEITAGDWIVGATSGARAEVLSVSLGSGTWAGGDAAGTLRIRCQDKTFTVTGENIKVGAGTNEATIAGNSTPVNDWYEHKGHRAKCALVGVYAQTALTAWDGGKPDQTALTGQPMVANSTIILRDIDQIRNFKCVDYTAASASTVNITCFF